jgi:hypothetical protein
MKARTKKRAMARYGNRSIKKRDRHDHEPVRGQDRHEHWHAHEHAGVRNDLVTPMVYQRLRGLELQQDVKEDQPSMSTPEICNPTTTQIREHKAHKAKEG